MKKLKIVIILFLVVFLSGCSGTYNLKINEDLTVDENVKLSIPITDGAYENTLNIFKDNKIPKNKYKVIVSDEDIKITYNEKYDSIEEYLLEDKLYKIMFPEVDYIKDKKSIRLTSESKFKLDENSSSFIVNDFNISLLQISIETPFTIISNNADSVTENKMLWTLNKNTSSKKMDFKIDIDKKSSSYAQIIVLTLIGIIVIFSILFIIKRFNKSRKI